MAGIIVGVDGSDHSRRALDWAMREAVKHQLPLTVMSIHPPPARPATSIYWGVHSYPENALTRRSRGWQSSNSWTRSRAKSAGA